MLQMDRSSPLAQKCNLPAMVGDALQFSGFISDKEYDVIMVDEAQDLNACDWDLILRQNCPKIIIGDPHQAIYQFRNAIGIPPPEIFKPTKTLFLRQSFRFGAEIASAAHSILGLKRHDYKSGAADERRKRVIGLPLESRRGTLCSFDDRKFGYTILARSNRGLFQAALREIARGRPIQLHATSDDSSRGDENERTGNGESKGGGPVEEMLNSVTQAYNLSVVRTVSIDRESAPPPPARLTLYRSLWIVW